MWYWKLGLLVFLFILSLYGSPLILAHASVVVVKMTLQGFVPAEVTIDENTTLNFVNDDSVAHWPASDLHPTHEVYSEFDPKKSISPGNIWLFRPTKVGTWKYHDHLFPHLRGILTVTSEGDSKPIKETATATTHTKKVWLVSMKELLYTIFRFFTSRFPQVGKPGATAIPVPLLPEAFKKLPADKQFDYLKSHAAAAGSEKAWQFILDTYKGESGTSGNIHDLAHLAGQLLYTEKGFSGLKECTTQLAFGCFHGFLDSAFKISIEKIADAEKACQSLGVGMSGPVASCVHGIGHGVASFYKTSDIKQALVSCDRLSEAARQYCYDGVFMEFERNAAPDFYKADQPLYPCNDLDPRYAFSCGRNQPQVLLQRFKKNFVEVVTICEIARSADFKNACFDALGFIAAASGKGVPQQVVGLCQNISIVEYKNKCVRAAAGEIVFQEMPRWFETAPQVCATLPPIEARECVAYIDQLMQEYRRIRPQGSGENSNAYIQSQMRVCLTQGARDECYKKIAGFLSSQFGLKGSLALLKTNEGVAEVYARCHEVTHYLSRNEYEKTKSVPQTYAQCDSTCHGGCYHGTLEAYLREKQISVGDTQVVDALRTVCGEPEDYNNLLVFYECMHGLGHAAMFVSDMEIPQSLALCDGLAAQNDRERCYSGVFMENSSSSTSTDHPGKYVRTDDPLYPCNNLEEKYQQLCYRYQSSYFALITNHNWQAVVGLCLKVPSRYQQDCFRTIGTNQVGFTPDLKVMKTDCDVMPEQFKATCYAGVIGSFAYRFVGDTRKMVEFCSLLDSGYQQNCVRNIGTSVVDWTNDVAVQQNFCQQTGRSEFISWCTQGLVSNRGTPTQAFSPN